MVGTKGFAIMAGITTVHFIPAGAYGVAIICASYILWKSAGWLSKGEKNSQ